MWGEDSVKLAYIVENAVKKALLMKQNNVKRLLWAKMHKNNSLMNQSLKILAQIVGSTCSKEFLKELQPPVSHQP